MYNVCEEIAYKLLFCEIMCTSTSVIIIVHALSFCCVFLYGIYYDRQCEDSYFTNTVTVYPTSDIRMFILAAIHLFIQFFHENYNFNARKERLNDFLIFSCCLSVYEF